MRLSDFGRVAQESFRGAVMAAMVSRPSEIVLAVSEQGMPANAGRVHDKVRRGQELTQSALLQRTGILIIFTAYFDNKDAAVQAASKMDTDELTRQIIMAGLPTPVMVELPQVFVSRPATIANEDAGPANSAYVSRNVGLVVGLVVGGIVLLVCCMGAALFYYILSKARHRNVGQGWNQFARTQSPDILQQSKQLALAANFAHTQNHPPFQQRTQPAFPNWFLEEGKGNAAAAKSRGQDVENTLACGVFFEHVAPDVNKSEGNDMRVVQQSASHTQVYLPAGEQDQREPSIYPRIARLQVVVDDIPAANQI